MIFEKLSLHYSMYFPVTSTSCVFQFLQKLYSITSAGFTVSVGCILVFMAYVHLTSQNVQFRSNAYKDVNQDLYDNEKIFSDFVKNINESIKRMDYDKEYTLKNMSQSGPRVAGNLNTEEEDDLHPLFLDIMKVSRLRQAQKHWLPDSRKHHDLNGYISLLHPNQVSIEASAFKLCVLCRDRN